MMSPQETNTVDTNTICLKEKKNNSPIFKDYFSFSKHKGDNVLLADS